MFTGIIEKTGVITKMDETSTGKILGVRTGFQDLGLGESVAVNGVCLTVADIAQDQATFHVSPETLEKTNLGDHHPGKIVNLERALSIEKTGANFRLSGHWVQGHVDEKGVIASILPEGDFYRITVRVPATINKFCIDKGSITIDGISLTINTIRSNESQKDPFIELSFQIIPHTWKNTHLHQIMVGDSINIETDIIGKYMEKLCQLYLKR